MKPDTIFAPATASGRAGIAVIRISGARAGAALRQLMGRTSLPRARVATRSRFVDPATGAALDDGIALWFPAPRSFTGESVAELHLHGGRAVVAAVLAALARLPGLRLAQPGEFTRRAFAHGKLDLTAVEGLADLVAAETEAQRRQALRQLAGELGALYESWRARLLRALAHAEAAIDFPEEALPTGVSAALQQELLMLRSKVAAHLADHRRGERLRDGLSIAVVGPPNAGKSSLVNWLARRAAAIVSAVAGTTRDVVEVHIDLGGYPAVVADTAGLRELPAPDPTVAPDPQMAIEQEGIARARARAEAADLKLLVLDAGQPALDPAIAAMVDGSTVVALNKVDLLKSRENILEQYNKSSAYAVSVKTGEGLPALLAALEKEAAARMGGDDAPLLTRARHRAALEDCVAALDRALAGGAAELVAEDMRLAARALGRITGRVGVEDILDIIFREFCIGK